MNRKEIIELILSRYVIVFGGRYSRGKSLSITALLYFAYLFHGRKNILSNMPFNLYQNDISYYPLTNTNQFDNLPSKTNVVMDEMQLDLNAKNSTSVKSKYISLFSRDVAKLDDRIIGSIQFFDTLEKVMGLILELVIIPEYINKYSRDTKEDNIKRLAEKDFKIKWDIWDRRDNERYELKFNAYPFIFMYNTKYKTMPLFINHKEYLEKLKKQEYELYEGKKDYELSLRNDMFYNGLKEVGKINIR